MEVRIDEWRCNERTGGVDFFTCARGQIRFDGDDAARFDADVDRLLLLRRGAIRVTTILSASERACRRFNTMPYR
jgi:hypothetical protein